MVEFELQYIVDSTLIKTPNQASTMPAVRKDTATPTLTPIAALSRQSTTQQARELLRKAIVDGALALGTPLSEQALSDELGVSRTPLREALHALQGEGLVEIEPYKGTRVFALTSAKLAQLSQFRVTVETAALELAMQNAGPALSRRLGEIVAEMQQCVAHTDTARYGELDTALHEAVITHCGNEYLVQAHRVVGSRLAVLRNLLRHDAETIQRSCDDHVRLLQLVEKGKTADAVAFLRKHIVNGTAFFAASLEGVLDASAPRQARTARVPRSGLGGASS